MRWQWESRSIRGVSILLEAKSDKAFVVWPALIVFPRGTESLEYADATFAWIFFGITLRYVAKR